MLLVLAMGQSGSKELVTMIAYSWGPTACTNLERRSSVSYLYETLVLMLCVMRVSCAN